MEIKGRSLLTGLPVRVNVSTDDLYEPVMMLSEQIGTAAHQVLEKTLRSWPVTSTATALCSPAAVPSCTA